VNAAMHLAQSFFCHRRKAPALCFVLIQLVSIVASRADSFTLLTYNVNGNGAADWSTNAPQVQAIGRQITYLKPDIITFNEIPSAFVWQMTNWQRAFLTNYFVATNSIGDSSIQNAIASRFPILSSTSHLHNISLAPYGYTNTSRFTRDLFEAKISLSNSPVPLHVFVAHLKATTGTTTNVWQDAANKRAAEASAVSNYFVTNFVGTNALHPFVLAGDMNEDAFFPETNNYATGHPIQRMTSAPTGLQLTTPVNPVTQTDLTESIRGSLDTRFDYIMPCPLLFSNIVSSQVFRTDLLNPLPANLFSGDDATASDHLPVLMTFANPFTKTFQFTSASRSNSAVALQWQSVPGQIYRIESSSNLTAWSVFVTNLAATNYSFAFKTNLPDAMKFFRARQGP
jgi:endonuclease/exonuclease/phosphatase family metal-dependent hydrolase